MKGTKTIYISLGSNLGNRHIQIRNAATFIGNNVGDITKSSNIYESEPWGINDQPLYLNQVLEVETNSLPHTVLDALQEYELVNGRSSKGDMKARTIDIDILFYENITIDEKNLTIPHPLLAERKFVLIPLCEIAPSFQHAQFGQTVEELLNGCNDLNKVRLWNPDELSIHNH